MIRNEGNYRRFSYLLVAALLLAFFPIIGRVYAAPVTSLQLRLSTIKESTLADHTIEFITPTGVSAGQTITITYPTGFALGSFNVNNYDMAMSSGASCSGFSDKTLAAAPSGTTWGVGTSGQVVTITSGTDTITAGRCVQIEIGSNATSGASGSTVVTNQSAAQNASDAKVLIGGTMSDSGTLAVEIVADNDVTVNATVDPSITCAFTGLTTTFASLTTGAISTSDTSTTITISTNAANGVVVSVRDEGNGSSPGLYKSSAPTYLIASADATLSAGTDGYGIQGSTSGGSGAALSALSPYNVSSNQVGGLLRTATSIASGTGPMASRVLTIVHKAAVSGLANAGSYTDNITYVCTGIF